jgi:hypothetical protein
MLARPGQMLGQARNAYQFATPLTPSSMQCLCVCGSFATSKAGLPSGLIQTELEPKEFKAAERQPLNSILLHSFFCEGRSRTQACVSRHVEPH